MGEIENPRAPIDFTKGLGYLHPNEVLKVNKRPLQPPGRDELLRTAVVAGPEMAGDRRVFLSVDLLTRLLDTARSSATRRVQVDRAGIRVDLYRNASGHQYEVWTLIGADPKPEALPRGFQQFVDNTRADRDA